MIVESWWLVMRERSSALLDFRYTVPELFRRQPKQPALYIESRERRDKRRFAYSASGITYSQAKRCTRTAAFAEEEHGIIIMNSSYRNTTICI
jgi:hypothetical protein